MDEQRKCNHCGKSLARRRYKSGTLEKLSDFRKRLFCDKRCAGKYQHSGSQPVRAILPKRKIAPSEYKTAAEFLSDVVNDSSIDVATRIIAAKALLPFQARRASEKPLGKTEEKAAAAKEAAGGKFARMQPPKVISIDTKAHQRANPKMKD